MINFFIKTYGCQANVADSQILSSLLMQLGCREVATAQEADLIVINTCAIREKAEQKLWSYLGKLKPLRVQKPYLRVGIVGCVASYQKTDIHQRFDLVNFVYGARDDRALLHAYVSDVVVQLETAKQLFEQNPTRRLRNGQDRNIARVVESKRLFHKPSLFTPTLSGYHQAKHEVCRSFVNIMTGCNKYCTYCIVPFTRGREISYPLTDIIAQVEHDVALGAKEVTLVGQNVNSYQDPETKALFPELLRRVAEVKGDFWIRFTSPHPQDMTIGLFDVMAVHRPKVTASLHFPLQSGSNRILALMNRNYTAEQYIEKIGWVRQRMPDVTISTDIIVGFPGETEEDFLATMALIEQVRYDLIYSFVYSPRQFTKASTMEDTCSYNVKQERLDRLQMRQKTIAYELNSANIGKTLICLVENRLGHGKLLARTEGNIRVEVDGSDELIGTFIPLRIEKAGVANMFAVRV